MLRLFTGIAAPPEINSALDDFVLKLKPLAPIRWSPASNFHITTKFIGAWGDDRLDELQTALATIPRGGSFSIAIRGFGFHPNARRPHVFFTNIDGGVALPELARRTNEACETVGVAREARPYSPHLTIARIDDPKGLGALHNALQQLTDIEFGEFTATSFHLYLSKPGRGGSVYTSLAEFPL
jgi:2'-5' RNA ligase